MGKSSEATLLLRIKEIGGKVLNKASQGLKALGKATIATVSALGAYTAGVIAFVREAEKFDEVQNAFRNLAANQGKDSEKMLANMKKLSAGTVADMELMKQANNALLLGLPVDRFGDMLTIARSASKATGESMDFMLKSIVTGLGRGSKLMLDNLGIVFKLEDAHEEYAASLGKTAAQLTEAERKQSFINKALEVGAANAKAAGAGSISLEDRWQQLNAKADNLKITIGQQLAPAFKVLLESTNASLSSFEKWVNSAGAVDVFTLLTKGVLAMQSAFTFLGETLGTQAGAIAGILEGVFTFSADKITTAIQTAGEMNSENFKNFFDTLIANNDKVDKEFKLRQKRAEKRKADASKTTTKARAADAKELQGFEFLKSETEKISQKARIDTLGGFLSLAAGLSRSSNKVLAGIGKAAALTDIAIKTPVAVASAFTFGAKIGGPPLGFAFGGIAAAAMAAQAAQVAGIQLADGGIVSATQGGTHAILGEGGQDEAVVPLDDAGGIGTTVNITVNGGFLGDESSARELALAVDNELFKLRQGGESVAFDEGII